MKLMQRILSRGLLIILIVAAGVAYYYRDQIFPGMDEEVAKESTTAARIERVETQQQPEPDTSPAQASAEEDTGTQAAAPAGKPQAAPSGRPGELASVQPPSMQPLSAAQMQQPAGSSLDSVAGPAEKTAPDPSQYRPTDEPAESGPDAGRRTMAGVETSLKGARSAYWAGDLTGAEQAYRAVMKRQPDNPDPAGELGNMLYAKGDLAGAAEAYSQAALRLQEQGETQRAQHLLRVVRGLDSDKAETLQTQLQ